MNYCQVMASGKESIFFKGVVFGRSTTIQWLSPLLGVYRQHKLDSMGYYKKTNRGHGAYKVRYAVMDVGEVRGDNDQNTLYEIFKELLKI